MNNENNEQTTLKINKVYNADIMDLLKIIPDNSIDMIFSDPDYNVGIKYNNKSYTTSFCEYINWYIDLAKECFRVLKLTGNMFFINYPKQNAYLRVKYLDQVCYGVYDYVWVYNTNVGHTPKRFTTAHRSILHCVKTKNSAFYKNNVAVPYQNPSDKRIQNNIKNGSKGRMPYDWFYFNLVKNVSKEKTVHSCQIPQSLSELLIKASTMPNDIVLILFGGSGSELEVCKKLNRNYISAEIDPVYYKMIIDRLEKGKIDDNYKLINVYSKKIEKKEIEKVYNR